MRVSPCFSLTFLSYVSLLRFSLTSFHPIHHRLAAAPSRLRDVVANVRGLECPQRSERVWAAALAPGLLLALVLWAGEAMAQQDVCRGDPYTGADGGTIACTETSGSNDIVIDPGSVNVAQINADHRGSGDITIRMTAGTLTGSGGNSILASRRGSGASSIVITGGTLTGIASSTSYGAPGTVSVSMSGGTLSGRLGAARNGGTGNAYVTVSGDATIRNTGNNAYGVFATNNGLGDELSVRMTGGSVETTGAGSHGIFVNASNDNGATAGPAMSVDLEGGSVRTRGNAHGVFFASFRGSRDASFRMKGGSIVTEADDVHSVDFWLRRFATGQTASVRMTGGSIVAEGLGSRGLASLELNLGSFDVMTGAGAMIAAPFAVGMEGLLEVDASATGRLVFAHGGAVEAREVGVLARAARSSGHTMGSGAQWADDAARTMPMIHVTSSGDITVGASVSDAFIRNRIAGADETLSAEEQAVLSAIMAGNSGALTTALAALPDDYDAAWQAEARNLLRKRTASSAAPTGDGPLAHRAAEEILGLSRAGIRAYALSHTGIVNHIRAGNALSTAERAALDAVLTKGVGTDLETALNGLQGATYTTAWKNTVRRLAATYNAGDIQVDVTGGSINAEGNGVEALYAVPHDSNGDITVTVAEGARIVGGANGVHVRGAGAGAGSLRAQSVTVNGRVTGGTGAGVRMAGGGRLTVGKTGHVGATSGMGVLSDGAGDLHATVAGRVEGDIRMTGTGALTLALPEGGVITGTIRDPVGLSTVVGSIGRLLYSNAPTTVTVASTGALTGVEVEGRTEALRSDAGDLNVRVAGTVRGDIRALGDGDLSATVTGTVDGDIRTMGAGTLTLTLPEGGVITGTIRDPVGLPTVAGSIGRLLYSDGATVTVASTGALTGVEVEGRTEALRSDAGDLNVRVAGTVRGDIRALGDGDLSATVTGTVDGDIRTMGAGTLTLALPEGGVVTGTVHDPVGPLTVAGRIGRLLYANGGTVTVPPTGRITGVSGEAIRSEAGDLTVTVAGMVEGDIRALGNGEHIVAVPVGGTVKGTVDLAGSTVTVGGTVGRITLATGGTVRVASTGQVTGVSAASHGIRVGDDSTIENRGTIAGTTGIQTGIQAGARSTIENHDAIIARTIGIQAGANSTIENHGTITGTTGIQTGAGNTVVNAGTVRSTAGRDGIAIKFQAAGGNTLTLQRGMTIIGKFQGLGQEDNSKDTVDLSDVPVDEVGLLTFVDENERPVDVEKMLRIQSPRLGVGRFIQVGNAVMGLDTTAFALTDDVLSDLTGSIHAAVLGTGLLAQAQDSGPAQGRVWAAPFGGWREQTGNGASLADGTHTFGGGLVGAGWGTPALSVGGFIGGSAGQLAVSGSRQNVDVQTVVGGAYAQQTLKDVQLDARVLVGHVAHDATRRVNNPIGSTAHATYTAFLFSPEVGAALRVPVTTTLHAVPRLRVRYAGLFTESFQERASVGNWDVGFAARAVHILEGRGEVSLPIALEAGGQVAPRLGVEGRWLLAGDTVEITLPGGSRQISAGGDPAVATGTLGLGLTLPVATGTTLVGNFDGALTTEHAWRATGYLGLTYSF